MLFDLNGSKFMVKFRRNLNVTDADLFYENTNLDGDKEFIHSGLVGTAMCSPKDRFEKSKGRKVALAKLICKMNIRNNVYSIPFTKEDRTRIWEIYFREHKK
jgi:hypothetical protein